MNKKLILAVLTLGLCQAFVPYAHSSCPYCDSFIVSLTLGQNIVLTGNKLPVDIEIENTFGGQYTFDYWLEGYRPNGDPYGGNPVALTTLTLEDGEIFTRSFRLKVPENTPEGVGYEICVVAGQIYPDAEASDCHEFEVIATP